MRIVSTKRRKAGAKRPDMTPIQEMLKDRRMWAGLGVVVKDGQASHWQKVANDVLVNVELVPDGIRIQARLGGLCGGPGGGLWRVPQEGDEVAVLIPSGDISFIPIIVGVVSSGEVPERLSPDRTVLQAERLETIVSESYLGSSSASQSMIKGTAHKAEYDTHFHGTPFGPTTGPTVPMNSLSSKHRIDE